MCTVPSDSGSSKELPSSEVMLSYEPSISPVVIVQDQEIMKTRKLIYRLRGASPPSARCPCCEWWGRRGPFISAPLALPPPSPDSWTGTCILPHQNRLLHLQFPEGVHHWPLCQRPGPQRRGICNMWPLCLAHSLSITFSRFSHTVASVWYPYFTSFLSMAKSHPTAYPSAMVGAGSMGVQVPA